MIYPDIPQNYTQEQKEYLLRLRKSIKAGSRYSRPELESFFDEAKHVLNFAEYGNTNRFGNTIVIENPNTGDATYIIFSIIDENSMMGQNKSLFTCLTNNL